VLLTLLSLGLRKIPSSPVRQIIALAAVGYLAFCLWDLTRYRGGIMWTLKPRIHEAEVARAAAREILGPNAKVASRITTWYASGAADLYDFSQTILVRPHLTPDEATQYLSNFDGVAEAGHMSNDTHNLDHKALLSWYVDGVLHLRGFYFADADSSLSYLLLQTNVTVPVRGFGLKAGKLHSFVENPGADQEFVALAGPYAAMNAILPAATFSHIMLLPRTESGKDEVLLTAIIPPGGPRNYSQLLPDCRILQRVAMSATILSPDALVAKFRREDRPMRFHQANIPGPNDSLGGAKDLPRVP
jgi:hypothetical protein